MTAMVTVSLHCHTSLFSLYFMNSLWLLVAILPRNMLFAMVIMLFCYATLDSNLSICACMRWILLTIYMQHGKRFTRIMSQLGYHESLFIL